MTSINSIRSSSMSSLSYTQPIDTSMKSGQVQPDTFGANSTQATKSSQGPDSMLPKPEGSGDSQKTNQLLQKIIEMLQMMMKMMQQMMQQNGGGQEGAMKAEGPGGGGAPPGGGAPGGPDPASAGPTGPNDTEGANGGKGNNPLDLMMQMMEIFMKLFQMQGQGSGGGGMGM